MKKYDCNKTMDFMHEIKRLCESFECDECPLVNFRSCSSIDKITPEMIDIVQKWSDENLGKTRLKKFKELIKDTEFEHEFYLADTSGVYSMHSTCWWHEPCEGKNNA